jgi:hypothetical protein
MTNDELKIEALAACKRRGHIMEATFHEYVTYVYDKRTGKPAFEMPYSMSCYCQKCKRKVRIIPWKEKGKQIEGDAPGINCEDK